MFPPISHLTSDGYDLQFGTNVLGRIVSLCPKPFLTNEYNEQDIITSPSFYCRC